MCRDMLCSRQDQYSVDGVIGERESTHPASRHYHYHRFRHWQHARIGLKKEVNRVEPLSNPPELPYMLSFLHIRIRAAVKSHCGDIDAVNHAYAREWL